MDLMNFHSKSIGSSGGHGKRVREGLTRSADRLRNLALGKIGRFIGLLFIFGVFLGSLVLVSLLAWYSKDLPNPDDLIKRPVPQTTKIYDRTGEHLLYEIAGEEKRTLVKLDQIPKYAVDAVILLEDKEFYNHKGLSWKGIVRIAVNPVLCKITANRFCSAGGSTITQQLVKNAILTNERTVSRKLKEILLTLEIERRFSKEQILQLYFNEIPYGSTNYGIDSAAQSYFAKSSKDLSIAEAATLAALPRSPSAYLNNLSKLKSRRDYAINLLSEAGKITKAQADEALNTEVKLAPRITNISAPHFVFYVREQLAKQFGEREVEQGGLKVITTLDFDKQKIAEEEVKNGVEKGGPKGKYTNAALVAIDPRSGQVLSMVGSKDWFDIENNGRDNVAISPHRQPGSSIKPLVYAAAFMKGYTPETVLWDVETDFPVQPKTYHPLDYDLKERGPVTLRKALQGSLNIPAVKLLYLVGLDRVLDLAKELGYTTIEDASKYGLSLTLGGVSVKLVEHVNAYGAFANDGVSHPLASILSVEKPGGEKLFEWQDAPYRVYDENIARTLTNVLSDNSARAYMFGEVNNLILGDRPVAAKTGTTNDYRDAWTVGYTPSLVAGVWAGNNDNSPMQRTGGTLAAAPIWNAFMKRALKGTQVENFIAPQPLPAPKTVLNGYHVDVPANADGTPGAQPTLTLEDGTSISNYGQCTPMTVDKITGLIATEYTPASFRETRFFCDVHDILHYVKKDDPLGPEPERPADDHMYQAWEDGVKAYLAKHQITLASPPTQKDVSHRPELAPFVEVSTPRSYEAIATRNISISATANMNVRPIARVEFWIDEVFLGKITAPPFNWSGSIPNRIAPGTHSVRVIVFDDIDNSREASIPVQVTASVIAIPVTITSPLNGANLRTTKFPVNIAVTTGSKVIALDLFIKKSGSAEEFYGSSPNPETSTVMTWQTSPGKGSYTLRVRAREEGDVAHWSEPIVVMIE